MSRDVEKDSMRDQADEEADLDVDIEKQTSRQELECATDETPMPGTTPPGDGSRESGEYETAEEGRHGFGATLDRVLSRASTKSVSPGPPPDGGLKAWMIGMALPAAFQRPGSLLTRVSVLRPHRHHEHMVSRCSLSP